MFIMMPCTNLVVAEEVQEGIVTIEDKAGSTNAKQNLDDSMQELKVRLEKLRASTSKAKSAVAGAEEASGNVDGLLKDLCQQDSSLCTEQ